MIVDALQIGPAIPMLFIFAGGVLLLLLEAFAGSRSRSYLMPITLGIIGFAMLLEVWNWKDSATARIAFDGMLTMDRMSAFVDLLFLASAALTAMIADSYMREHKFEHGEFYALLMFATGGMMMLGAATDLLTVFLGVETMSIAVYVLTGSWRRNARSSEAAFKYFLYGAFAAAILLYGIALVYGATGATNLVAIGNKAAQLSSSAIFDIGILFILVAFGFKIAAVPFHMWAPDAYEGAPTPVTAFMAAGVKTAAFAAILRIFGGAFDRSELAYGSSGWASIFGVIAILTMTLGNLAALRQDNIKRMLAYSSIAHAGYLLLGVIAVSYIGQDARGPLLFYLAAYTFTTAGAFGVVAWIGSKGDERLMIDDWAGLAGRHPGVALAMTIFMLSLGGVPPTAGFFGKFYVFRAALQKPTLVWLVIIAVLNSVVSVFYYLRVVTAMYFREAGREVKPLRGWSVSLSLILAAVGVLVIGILPTWIVDVATAAGLAQ